MEITIFKELQKVNLTKFNKKTVKTNISLWNSNNWNQMIPGTTSNGRGQALVVRVAAAGNAKSQGRISTYIK